MQPPHPQAPQAPTYQNAFKDIHAPRPLQDRMSYGWQELDSAGSSRQTRVYHEESVCALISLSLLLYVDYFQIVLWRERGSTMRR
jgi:hypothetical protein